MSDNVTLRTASTLAEEELAALFTAVYAGYVHPIEIDVAALRRMVATYDLELDAGVVAFDEETPVAVALLGVRGTEGWVGGMGVLPERRGAGIGTRTCERLLANASGRGLARVRLEVLVQNAPALAVYRRLGFAPLRDVAVWRLDEGPHGADAEDADLDDALAELAGDGAGPPWQRSSATVARMREAGTELVAVRSDGGVAVFSPTPVHASLHLLAAPTVAAASALLRAPFARGAPALLWLNGPVDGVAADALRHAGASELARQHELAWLAPA